MARVVSLTLFLLSWLLLFSYAASYSELSECQVCTKVVDHIYQQVQKNSAQICPTKVEKIFDPTDVADFICKIQPQIDKLAYRVCYDLYPDACSVKPPSTKDGILRQPLVPKPSNDAEIVNKDSEQKTKGKKRNRSNTDDQDPGACSVKTPSTKEKEDSKEKGNFITPPVKKYIKISGKITDHRIA